MNESKRIFLASMTENPALHVKINKVRDYHEGIEKSIDWSNGEYAYRVPNHNKLLSRHAIGNMSTK